MQLKIKSFDELTKKELYEILLLRSEVFVKEQGNRYQDPDRTDYDSLHIFYEEEDHSVSGCLRIFQKADEPGTVQIGRVVTAAASRGKGLGERLMETAEKTAKERYGAASLYLTGRKSALGFYKKCGFYTASEELSGAYTPYYEFRKEI